VSSYLSETWKIFLHLEESMGWCRKPRTWTRCVKKLSLYSWSYLRQILTNFLHSFTSKFSSKFVIKSALKVPLHLNKNVKYVTPFRLILALFCATLYAFIYISRDIYEPPNLHCESRQLFRLIFDTQPICNCLLSDVWLLWVNFVNYASNELRSLH